MLNPTDMVVVESLRRYAEFCGQDQFVGVCSAALRGEAWAAERIEEVLLDFSFAPCDESRVLEIMKKTDCARPEGGCLRCGRSDGSHVGYHEDSELPIRRGDRVRIRAGAEIWTTLPDPAHKRFTLARSRVITVHSMDCGQTTLSSAKRQLLRLEAADLERGLLHSQHPGVCWVGTGGYWHHAALSDVELVKAR